ncbi:type IX secretion system anionic LPS delivery protein PorZ [Saccharicrinis aurantiacus]|uniref:type IX secretion system anionic LPS delivery protein PorZ n=1 Tax=Saccharicrinis aurantiacus TaxID=1849719 RepID=UPI00083802D6|nr:two-component regulator propeller domain-containing protein [Saccharicrinis aurantiacus]
MNKVLLIILSLSYSAIFSQVPIGAWQEHIAVNDVFQVQKSENKIFSFARNGYFVVDSEEETMTKYTKLNRLSDVDISAAIILPDQKSVMIGYANGNIDIIEGDNCINIPDLKLKQLSVSKVINNITIVNKQAFCSTDFGILVVDYKNHEIEDTYYIGDNAAEIKINQICTQNDSIYAATDIGLLGAPIASNALAFYETWKNVYPANEFLDIIPHGSGILAVRKSNNKLYEENNIGNNWSSRAIESSFVKYQQTEEVIYSIYEDSIQVSNKNLELQGKITFYDLEDKNFTPNFTSVIEDGNKTWLGDEVLGLVEKQAFNDIQYLPNGPSTNRTFKIAASEGVVYAVPGIPHENSYTPTAYPAELSILKQGSWEAINKYTDSKLIGLRNFCDIAIDPNNHNKVYIASRYGIVEFENSKVSNHFTHINSTIEPVDSWDLINGLAIDDDGNLYANNQSISFPIQVKFGNEKRDWRKNEYYYFASNEQAAKYRNMIISSQGFLWSTCKYINEGLYVFDFNNTLEDASDDTVKGPIQGSEDNRCEYLKFWDENGAVIDVTPNALCEDKDGYIWIGTNSGILVYYRPERIFEEEKPVASRIKISREDSSDLADYLLDNVVITAIQTDGANRKWIGTETDGVYCVSPDGIKTIHHFNKDNSPLLSNFITTIAIDPSNGMVYFGTDNGIVSYMNEAVNGKESYNEVYAFPNPVQPGYEGVITIANLVDDSTVRITDVSGKLVYQGISLGGRLVWNGRNIYNDKVKSGVYIVYATNKDGSETVSTKIMIIN